MRQGAFLAVILVGAASASAQSWQGDLLNFKQDFHASVAVTWGSKYLWRGFDFYDDKGAVHLLTDLSLFDTGFGVAVAGHRAAAGGFEDKERWDFTGYYQNRLFKDEPYLTQFRFGWTYYMYPELNAGESLDLQEGQLMLSWPNILPIKGLVPTYEIVTLWQAHEEGRLADGNGWLHFLMLDYGFSIPNLIGGGSPEQIVKLHSEVMYNDGFSPTPTWPVNDWRMVVTNPDHDWSDAVFGVSTDFNLGSGIAFTPALYYQITLNDTFNQDDNELWASLSLKWSF